MNHPLLHLMATRPQLLADHAQAYAGLLAEEAGQASATWRRRATLQLGVLSGAALAATLGGVALMLWATRAELTALPASAAAVLLAVPALPALAALACLLALRHTAPTPPFEQLRQQLQNDLSLLRDLASTPGGGGA